MEIPVLQHCGVLMFHHHRMLSSLLFRQMFQKHSDTDVYPLTSVEEELKRIGEKMATAAATLKPEFSSQKDVKHKELRSRLPSSHH